jgi:hypothetical protein
MTKIASIIVIRRSEPLESPSAWVLAVAVASVMAETVETVVVSAACGAIDVVRAASAANVVTTAVVSGGACAPVAAKDCQVLSR